MEIIKKCPASQGIQWIISDTIAMTWRGLLRYISLPQLIVFSTIQPILFLLLFTYVFGGAIKTPGTNYINYLVPGILVQIVTFGSMQTGIGLADDLSKGLIDRFRSLPMSRMAMLAGRTISDLIRNVLVVLLMVEVATAIGFDSPAGFIPRVLAFGLIAIFGFAFSWISVAIGLLVKNSETAQVAGFVWIFPLVFASSIFVPIETMPSWLQSFAKISPVTVTVNSVRALILNNPIGDNLWQSLAWIVGITMVFAALSVWMYRRLE